MNIFIIYFACLALVPCMDIADKCDDYCSAHLVAQTDYFSQSYSDDSGPLSDNCPPLRNCSCCRNFAIELELATAPIVEDTIWHRAIFADPSSNPLIFMADIWQPPRQS